MTASAAAQSLGIPELSSARAASTSDVAFRSKVAALKHNMAAEYAAQEREVLDRIAQLEARVK